ncbi:MAG: hypothetical protein M1827_002842 [Pycnora praestabilis]|nr:MAG: hypothetical protein M1827_002842 [Pycnora praestabilis]
MPYRLVLSPRSYRPWNHSIARSAFFHASSTPQVDSSSHYKTLGLQSTASAAEIKKQFYFLSKTHHPDHNPNDPEASARFVNISEAYAVLGNIQKRERYDHDFERASGPSAGRRGSHSSTSGPAGARPASGLSRRRTQYRGPPPSFYRSGGWGTQGNKRQAEADSAASASRASGERSDERPGEGFGIGGAQATWDDVPHFDREGHLRTQEQQDQRRRRRMTEELIPTGGGGSVLINFIFVGSIISLAIFLPTLFERKMTRKATDERER